jgi:hypothetical protein
MLTNSSPLGIHSSEGKIAKPNRVSVLDHLQAQEFFKFPFPPYQLQCDFMTSLVACIESGHIGVFESPTGTVSTISMLNKTFREGHDRCLNM